MRVTRSRTRRRAAVAPPAGPSSAPPPCAGRPRSQAKLSARRSRLPVLPSHTELSETAPEAQAPPDPYLQAPWEADTFCQTETLDEEEGGDSFVDDMLEFDFDTDGNIILDDSEHSS